MLRPSRSVQAGSWAEARLKRECRKYGISLRAGLVTPRSDGNLAAQQARFAASVARLRALEEQARELLFPHGVTRLDLVGYYRFIRHLAKLEKSGHDEAFEMEARASVLRWTKQGLRRDLLEALCRRLFDLRPPGDVPVTAG